MIYPPFAMGIMSMKETTKSADLLRLSAFRANAVTPLPCARGDPGTSKLKTGMFILQGKVCFTPSNYHKRRIFNLQLRNRIIETIYLLKPGKFGFESGFQN